MLATYSESDPTMSEQPQPAVIRLDTCRSDAEGSTKSNGRKVFATERYADETHLEETEWAPPAVVETGPGAFEVATLTEFTKQDRHRHRRSTEHYIVLAGHLELLVDDAGPVRLEAGDHIVLPPGVVHEVLEQEPTAAPGSPPTTLVRVIATDCHGAADKEVQLEEGGPWHVWAELDADQRRNAYRVQPPRS